MKFDEIYKIHDESSSAKTKLPKTEKTLAVKVDDFNENIRDLGYKFDIKKDDNFSNIKVALKNITNKLKIKNL